MSAGATLIDPDALRTAVHERTLQALRTGALQTIATKASTIEDGGVRFVVRRVSSLERKHEQRVREAERAGAESATVNPFLPYDPELFVADVSPTHICLLNKFNVLEHHLLIVTRSFEDQEVLLTRADFAALWPCLRAVDGLGFYNGGSAAGASQPHKHLQFVPRPLTDDGPAIPVEPLITAAAGAETIAGLPFRNACARFGDSHADGPGPDAAHASYRALLAVAGIAEVPVAGEARQSAPYNLLITRRWMLVVPRSRECFRGVSVNALGFAGSLFVRNAEQMRTVRETGPMAVLAAVATD